jgi:hypothetical protein
MRPLWMTRLARVIKPPKCRECGCNTEGGLYCDVCGQRLIDASRDNLLARAGPRVM